MFDFSHAAVAIRPEIAAAFRREWDRLASPGSALTASDRVGVAAAARDARAGRSASGAVAGLLEEAARRVAAEPATIRRGWVEKVTGEVGFPKYVETVGVVSRLTAIDGFHRAVGMPLEPLPEPRRGKPSGETDERARQSRGYVPMVGGTSIVGALSLVPAEMHAQEDLHGPLYLTYEQMSEQSFQRGLHRTQIELIAARTSIVNECFY